MRPELPKPIDPWAPHREGNQANFKFARVHDLNTIMATVWNERWHCQGNVVWANIECTEAEASSHPPLSREQWALRTAFPLAAQWAIDRRSKKPYDEGDDEMGEMRGDKLLLNTTGREALRTTQADLGRLMAEQGA